MSSPGFVSIKLEGVDKLLKSLDPQKVQGAAKAAIGRTKTSARSEASKLITSVWNIGKRNLETMATGKPRIEVSGGVGNDLSATITFWSGGISLVYFGAKEFRLTAARSRQTARRGGQAYSKGAKTLVGIRVQTLRGGPTAMLRQFFSTMRSGHKGVFRRDPAGGKTKAGNARIIESSAVGIATMVNQPRVLPKLKQHILDTFQKRFTHELKQRGVIG
jgi:hypothetical protein